MKELIKQKNNKDCHICCLSFVLDIDYYEIPKFYNFYPEYGFKEDIFKDMYDKWLDEIGFYRIMCDVSYDKKNNIVNLPHFSKRQYKAIANLHSSGRLFSHSVAVIIDNDSKNIEMKDPSIIETGLDLRDIKKLEIFIKK